MIDDEQLDDLDARSVHRTRQTSIDVYREMEASGLLSARRWEVYEILWHHGPMTSNEIFQHARLHGNPNYRHNTNARMTELRDLGVAQELGATICQVTKRRVILWDVTDRLPVKSAERIKGPTRKQLIAEIERLRARCAALESEVARLRVPVKRGPVRARGQLDFLGRP
jgi:hypothetical protein